ncbi:MAG: PH domain-containing protein [Planctomycetota bacterium]
MTDSAVVLEARFDEKVCDYWLVTGALSLIAMIFTIPLLLLWFPLGKVLTRRYLERMSCVLTDRQLLFKKGYFVRVEKTVPLDRITDLGVVQGPIMRHFGVSRLTIETAGQSAAGAVLSMSGIVDARGYREKVLEVRDALIDGKGSVDTAAATAPPAATIAAAPSTETGNADVLTEVRDTLNRIEALLRAQADGSQSRRGD